MASRRTAVREHKQSPVVAPATPAMSGPPLTLLPSPRSYSASRTIPACIRQDMIQQAAYFLAEQRGFTPGHELGDWLAAERQIESLIRERYG
jgi:hypothetical protein